MTTEAVAPRRRPLIPTLVGTVLLLAPLAVIAASAVNQTWRSGIDDYFAVALAPTLIATIALLLLATRRRPGTAWALALGAVALAVTVVVGGLLYEEWLETQPGGRGHDSAAASPEQTGPQHL